MINSNLLAVVESTLTDTASGNWQKPLVMFVCNLLALLVISRRKCLCPSPLCSTMLAYRHFWLA
jgi:hypothetical protein